MSIRIIRIVLAALFTLPALINTAAAHTESRNFVFSMGARAETADAGVIQKRLKHEARTHCRIIFDGVGGAGVVSGCQRAIFVAVKEAIAGKAHVKP